MTDEVVARIIGERLLVVHGDSGCGKSSLIFAGVLPLLEQDSRRSGNRWRSCDFTPGDDPLWRLAQQLSKLRPELANDESVLNLRRTLNFGPESGEKLAELLKLGPRDHVCIVVDQFEEIFAHAKRNGSQEASLLVDFLIGIRERRPSGLSAVLTMRSEFFGACAQFHHFAEVVNDTQYLVPRMEHEDLMRAIREPAALYGGQIDRGLAERLIADAAAVRDPLPLIQHGLMLLYRETVLDGATEPPDHWRLGLEHYQRGEQGLAELLSNHADEIVRATEERLSSGAVTKVVEHLFRAITDVNAEGQAIRRPQRLKNLISITGEDEAVVRGVIDAFRAEGVSLLRPYGTRKLSLEERIDVSHEALIRSWQRIADPKDGWSMKEFKAGLLWRSLLVQADTFALDPSSLLSPAAAEEREAWLRDYNAAWSERYGGGWDRVQRFVEASITERDRRRKNELLTQSARARARLLAVVAVVAVVAGATGALGYYVLFVRLTKWHYASFVVSGFRVHGVGRELKGDQKRHRPVSYEIVTQGRLGQALQVTAFNAAGERARVETEYAGTQRGRDLFTTTWRFVYDSDGRLTSELQYSHDNKLVQGKAYVPTSDPNTRRAYFIGYNGMPTPVHGQLEGSGDYWAEEVRSSATGKTVRYLGPFGEAVPGEFQAFGTAFSFDADWNLVEQTSLDAKGAPSCDTAGNATLRLNNDELGNTLKAVSLDAQGNPVFTDEGWVIRRSSYDDFGNLSSDAYFDAKERPVATSNGWHRLTYTRDEQGHIKQVRYFAVDDKPAMDAKQGCYGRLEERDALNQLLKWTCLDAAGKPLRGSEGFAGISTSYDSDGHMVSEIRLDEASKPMLGTDGISAVAYKYQDGRVVEERYSDENAQPTLNQDGYFRLVRSYDDSGRGENLSYFGIDGNPVEFRGLYASLQKKRDLSWRTVEEKYLDRLGQPAMTSKGYSGMRWLRDARGQAVQTNYLGKNGEVVFSLDGYAGWTSEFDDFGRESGVHYIGPDGQAVVKASDGIAGWRSRFDQWGHQVEQRYFGLDGLAAVSTSGGAEWRARYDASGHQIEVAYVDGNGRPTLHTWDEESRFDGTGFATLKRKHDTAGRIVEESYLGVDAEPALQPDNWSRWKTSFDARGLKSRTEYFNGENRTMHKDGFHAVGYAYDLRGNVTELKYFDVAGAPCNNTDGYAVWKRQYDRLGKIVDEEFRDLTGERVSFKPGVYRVHTVRDFFGREKRIEEFGAKGELVDAVESDYDTQGNVVEQRFKGADDALVVTDKQPCAVLHQTWNERGERTVIECRDPKGALSPNLESRAARTVYVYGQPGQVIEERHLDPRERPVAGTDGWATVRYTYDPQGRQVEAVFLDPAGKQADGGLGYAKRRTGFDAFGNQTVRELFGSNGSPARPVARVNTEFDALQRKVRETYWGPGSAKARLNGAGQHVTLYHYDDYGNIISLTYLDAQGLPTRGHALSFDPKWQLCGRWVIRPFGEAPACEVQIPPATL